MDDLAIELRRIAEQWNRLGRGYRIVMCAADAIAVNRSAEHPDDLAVDRFANAMKVKLAACRENGRGGWETPACTEAQLQVALRQHLAKGDPVDVGNFAMMLFNRGERTK